MPVTLSTSSPCLQGQTHTREWGQGGHVSRQAGKKQKGDMKWKDVREDPTEVEEEAEDEDLRPSVVEDLPKALALALHKCRGEGVKRDTMQAT